MPQTEAHLLRLLIGDCFQRYLFENSLRFASMTIIFMESLNCVDRHCNSHVFASSLFCLTKMIESVIFIVYRENQKLPTTETFFAMNFSRSCICCQFYSA